MLTSQTAVQTMYQEGYYWGFAITNHEADEFLAHCGAFAHLSKTCVKLGRRV